MSKKILITGGAGFIGSHIADVLVDGNEVVVFDNLDPQVHESKPEHLQGEFIKGDVRDREALSKAIDGCDVIFHEASAVGVGQSMYQIQHYVDVNTTGTANLLDILVNDEHDVKKLIVAASMSSYGEGKYECDDCGVVYPELRSQEQMDNKEWELKCKCGKILRPVPTGEDKVQVPNSIYALSKKDQEDMCLMIGKTYGIPAVALRYFNVYGPRQSLSNPYTGVAAIFMSRIKNNNTPVIYEDGLQTRDFISVHDIASANKFVMNSSNADYGVYNVGNGVPITIKGVAEVLAKVCGKNIAPKIVNDGRKGDVRHCYADMSKLNNIGWKPSISFEDGIAELVKWSDTQQAEDKFEDAERELKERGLVKKE